MLFLWYNFGMENEVKRTGIIKKLNMIYKKGYMPSRGIEEYGKVFTPVVNCFGHACFNLSNEMLEELSKDKNKLSKFFRTFETFGLQNLFREAKKRVQDVGLKFESSGVSEKLQNNQWKIAVYTKSDEFTGNDLHFMIQMPDGKWTSKLGSNSEVEVYNKLPRVFHSLYDLYGVYKITNPYVKSEKEYEKEMEM